jgi:hypothetical protein
MKYWKYYKVPVFFSWLFRVRMERLGWKVTKVSGVILQTYRVSTYDRELYMGVYD